MKKIAVYTTLFGVHETLKDPEFITPETDYYCFTNIPDFESDVWKTVCVDTGTIFSFESCSSRRMVKSYKMQSHQLFDNYEYSIWQNNNIIFDKDVNLIINQLEGNVIGAIKHPKRTNIIEELEACVEYYPDEGEDIMRLQIETYIKVEKMPLDYPLYDTTILVRKNTQEVAKLNNLWWKQIKDFCNRDQLSFGYCLWKTRLKCSLID